MIHKFAAAKYLATGPFMMPTCHLTRCRHISVSPLDRVVDPKESVSLMRASCQCWTHRLPPSASRPLGPEDVAYPCFKPAQKPAPLPATRFPSTSYFARILGAGLAAGVALRWIVVGAAGLLVWCCLGCTLRAGTWVRLPRRLCSQIHSATSSPCRTRHPLSWHRPSQPC